MDELDRAIVNALQGGFPLCERPFKVASEKLNLQEQELLERIQGLLRAGVLTRFGPMYDVERMGGAFMLCAMSVAAEDVERVAALVNAHPEVAHNYERVHRFNLWFVLACPSKEHIGKAIAAIEAETGHRVMSLPREEEYFVELKLTA